MATYYAVGTGNWSGSSTVWATSSGGSPALTTPTTTDDVVFDVNSTGTVTCGTTDACRNMTMTAPGAGTLTMGATAVITCAGNWSAAAGMTLSVNTAATINMTATTTGKTFNAAAYLYGIVNFNGVGGGWTLTSAISGSGTSSAIGLVNGALDTGSFAVGGANGMKLSSNNSNTRSLTLGTTTWTTPNVAATVWDITTSTGMTLSALSSTINNLATTTAGNFSGGGLTYGTVTFAATTASITVNGVNTFGTFSCTSLTTGTISFLASQSATTMTLNIAGTAKTTTSGYSLAGNLTVSGTFTMSASTNLLRNFIYSSVFGTQRTISAGTVAVTNTDLRDIVGAGAGSWNFSALTSTANGDCGGNSGITFTAPKNCYLKVNAAANWSASNWFTTSGGATPISPPMPLPQDTALADANTGFTAARIITIDQPRICGFDQSGLSSAVNIANISDASAVEIYGSLIFKNASNTWTGASPITFAGRGSYVITTYGVTFGAAKTFNAPTGTYLLNSNLPVTGAFQLSAGTLNMGGFNIPATTTGTITGGTLILSGQLNCTTTFTQSGGAITDGFAAGKIITGANNNMSFTGGTASVYNLTTSGTANIAISGTASVKIVAGGSVIRGTGALSVTGVNALFSTGGPVANTTNGTTTNTMTVGPGTSFTACG